MTAPDTDLGLHRIDPDTDQHRLAYQTINLNAEKTNELIEQDREQLALLSDAVSGASPNRVQASSGTAHVAVGLTRVAIPSERYSAFPSVAKLLDGRLFMVWYEATNHIAARDGIVVGAYSSDNGKTWTAKQTVYSLTGIDLRDPTVSTSTDGTTLFLTYIKCTDAAPRNGFFLRKSTDDGLTWGAEVRIDPVGSNGAGTAPVIQLANGLLFAVWYGMLTGEAYDSCYYATSPDLGQTWSVPVKFKNGVADSRHYEEPVACVQGDKLVVLFRWGNNDGIGTMSSTDGGATWSTPVRSFGGSGRPSVVFTTEGTIVTVYRNNDSGAPVNQHGMLRTSKDLGVTWTAPKLVEPAMGGWWAYSGILEISPGHVLCVSSIELTSLSTTELSARYLTEGGAMSPFGDPALPLDSRALNRRNSLAAVDTFDRPDSSALGRTDNGVIWVTGANGQIKDGAFQNAGTAVGVHVVNARTYNVDVEAELYWETNAGVYLVFRYADASNYWMCGPETSGTAFRLYKVVAGTATQVATTSLSFPAAVWHKVKVSTLEGVIRVFVEDVQVLTATDNTAPLGVFAGVRAGIAGTTTHRARNLVIHRRSGFSS